MEVYLHTCKLFNSKKLQLFMNLVLNKQVNSLLTDTNGVKNINTVVYISANFVGFIYFRSRSLALFGEAV